MAIDTSLSPIPSGRFGFVEAQHLLNRAGFGGTPAQVEALREMGVRKAVDFLVDYGKIHDPERLVDSDVDPDLITPPTPEQRRMFRASRQSNDRAALDGFKAERRRRLAEDRRQVADLEQWWMARIIATPRPLEEKLVLLWHSHFASNYRTVRDSFLMYRQNMFFRKHANGSFAALAGGIIRDPAMIRFLDNHNNRKRKPNENLARELMELFTLGEGNYIEQDIKEGARALTGYTLHDNDFFLAARRHDDGEKTILGRKGKFDGDEFVRILLAQPACARFVSYKLYKHFVADLDDEVAKPARTVILKMARMLRAKDYQMAPLLKTLFRSRHLYDPAVMAGMVKSPVQLIAGTIRSLGTPTRDIGVLADAAGAMGQRLFNPPSVAGWSGGRSWINTSTLFVRQNVTTFLITGKLPFDDGWTRQDARYDPMFLVADLARRDPESVVDHLLRTLVGGKIATQRRGELAGFLRERGGELTTDGLIGLLLLATAVPEYQLC